MPLPLLAIGAVAGAVQAIGGLIGAKKNNAALDRLFKQRKKFQTPSEIYDIVNMTQNNQAGYSPETLSYLTDQADTGLSSALGTATRLGADPNQLGSELDSYFKDIFKIGSDNELIKMKKFDSLINATQLLANNKEAEWASGENLIKDQMAAQAAKLANSQQNIQSGLNAIIDVSAAAATPDYDNGGGGAKITRKTVPAPISAQQSTGDLNLSPSQLLKIQQLKAAGLLD